MAKAAEGEAASLCDAVSDDLRFGSDCQRGKKGLRQLLFWAGLQHHPSASNWVSSPAGLTCAAQGCWKSTCQ